MPKKSSSVPKPGDNNAKKSVKQKSGKSQQDPYDSEHKEQKKSRRSRLDDEFDDNAGEVRRKENTSRVLVIVNIKNKKSQEEDRMMNLMIMQEEVRRKENTSRVLVIVNIKNKKS